MSRTTLTRLRDLILCGALVFALRAGTFFHTVIDWDESLYLLIARGLLHGEVPYVDQFDHKPPGVYALFALAQLMFGERVAAIRIAACLAVTATAWLLLGIGRRLERGGALAGWTAAVLYAVYSLRNLGLGANTELFFNAFTTLAFSLVLAGGDRPGAPRLAAAGAAAGIAVQIKYVVVFDVAVLFGLAAIALAGPGRDLARAARGLAIMTLGAAAPLLAVVAYFTAVGHLGAYAHANFAANVIHRADTPFEPFVFAKTLFRQAVNNAFLWLAAAATIALLRGRLVSRSARALSMVALAWTAAALLGAQLPKRLYEHYFLALLPPLCLQGGVVAAWVADQIAPDAPRRRLRVAVVTTLLLAGPVLLGARHFVVTTMRTAARRVKGDLHHGDPTAAAAAHLRTRIRPQHELYVFDGEPVLYHLLGIDPPTRFAFPPFLIEPHFARVAGVDALAELHAILGRRPQWIVKQYTDGTIPARFDPRLYAALDGALAQEYQLDAHVGESAIYRLKGAEP